MQGWGSGFRGIAQCYVRLKELTTEVVPPGGFFYRTNIISDIFFDIVLSAASCFLFSARDTQNAITL
jgi:hypothetical protein